MMKESVFSSLFIVVKQQVLLQWYAYRTQIICRFEEKEKKKNLLKATFSICWLSSFLSYRRNMSHAAPKCFLYLKSWNFYNFEQLSSWSCRPVSDYINIILKQKQSGKKCLKVNTKWLGFLRGESWSILFMDCFSILTILNPPQEIITEFTVKSPVF